MSTAVSEVARTETSETESEGLQDEVPAAVASPRPALSWGRLAVVLLVAEALSGLVLMFYYRPTAVTAYLDLVDLREVSRLGFVRALHRWGSHAVVILVWVHLVRVALRATYPRRKMRAWAGGIALMLPILLLATTGYLLPWDQQAFWSLHTAVPVVGESTPEDAILLRFYLMHCVALPLLVAGLTADHLRRARRDPGPAQTLEPEVRPAEGR